METNIRDYPLYYWIIALSFDVIFNVAPVLVSFYSFYNERDKFFKDANFRNEAFERYEKEKLKNKIPEEQQKNKLSKSEILPQINQNKPTISENINNNVNNNDKNVNNNASSVAKSEITFNQNKSPEEKKYSYQNYLKNSTAHLNQINQVTDQTVNNYNVHIDSKNQLNTIPTYTNVKFYSESNLMDNNSNKINFDNLNKDFAEDLKHIDRIENAMLRKYRREIRCGFIITIVILIIDTYCNIDTFINLKPRFLDTQFILYNNSYLINEENLIYNKNVVYEKYLKLANHDNANEEQKSTKADSNLKNKVIESDKENNNDSNQNLKFVRLLNSNYSYQDSEETDINSEKNFDKIFRSLNQEEVNRNEDLKQHEFIYSNLQEYVNITLKREFNISKCKHYSKSDLNKIDYIYQYSAVRYSLLIINTILDLFIMMLTTVGFLYKVEINKLYQSKFILVLLFLLNKCWSMCAVAHSYFDLTTNECLNAIDYFSEFFYAYLSYVFLFFSLIFIIIIYSLFCRQLLYYILMILVSGLTLFIPALFCLEKQQKCMKKIYEEQELRLKDDLEDIRNLRFRRKKQNFQLLMAYLVFVFIVLNGLSALVNFGILKYIWIVNSWRTLAPAVGSITTFVVTFFQRCYN